MAYNFSRTDDYAIIDWNGAVVLVTRESLPIFIQSTTIYVPSHPNAFNCSFSDVGAIDGITPADINDAALRLGKVFKGYAPIKVTIE